MHPMLIFDPIRTHTYPIRIKSIFTTLPTTMMRFMPCLLPPRTPSRAGVVSFLRDLRGDDVIVRHFSVSLFQTVALHPHFILTASTAADRWRGMEPLEIMAECDMLHRPRHGPLVDGRQDGRHDGGRVSSRTASSLFKGSREETP